MADCERCKQMPGYCRQCATRRRAERLYQVYLVETMGCPHSRITPDLAYDLLTQAKQRAWLAVALASQSAER